MTAHGGYRGFLGHTLADDEGGTIGKGFDIIWGPSRTGV